MPTTIPVGLSRSNCTAPTYHINGTEMFLFSSIVSTRCCMDPVGMLRYFAKGITKTIPGFKSSSADFAQNSSASKVTLYRHVDPDIPQFAVRDKSILRVSRHVDIQFECIVSRFRLSQPSDVLKELTHSIFTACSPDSVRMMRAVSLSSKSVILVKVHD